MHFRVVYCAHHDVGSKPPAGRKLSATHPERLRMPEATQGLALAPAQNPAGAQDQQAHAIMQGAIVHGTRLPRNAKMAAETFAVSTCSVPTLVLSTRGTGRL
eukprot:CAMPEP_0198597932 /NCGR_PEP_ID=MMETSP1462-20131121/145043_1 /TAXON_ID=1333877 /ORGANISM="Brandtodinium nutriculum, Strain RCC3387" /LENGTH=101 /DNA_ID=CAMNT_0044329593 /DNA_START=265 /DNA_END=567 /DNA_ORIENTATION=-